MQVMILHHLSVWKFPDNRKEAGGSVTGGRKWTGRWENKCGELEWEEDGEPGVGMERGQETVEKINKVIIKKMEIVKSKRIVYKESKKSRTTDRLLDT